MNFDKTDTIPLIPTESAQLPKRAKRADAIANRELILATAQRLFAERGIANICMAAIAETAGVGKGTLYRGFANKGELCLALLDEDMRAFQNQTLHTLRENYHQPALSRLDAFLNSLVYFVERQAPLLREAEVHGVLQSEMVAGNASPHHWLPWLHQTIGILLQQAQQNGETHDLDIPYLVDAILAPLSADLFLYQRETLGFDLQRMSQGLRQLVLEGCRKRE
ncbi:MAG: TetR/AcrR family transcriptional regulator [Anaerolineales bacterium]|nr:TetR/AcrR family transcriptional regulator [Anaerolineales bacterium]